MTSSIDNLKSVISSRGGLARPNNFLVELPAIGTSSREMNILCRQVSMPGKQIMSVDRRIGMEYEKIPYGYAIDDVTMNFLLTNNYSAKRYFNLWRSLIINENKQVANYKVAYQKRIKIHQLVNGLPSNSFNFQVGPAAVNVPIGNILNSFAVRKGVNISRTAYSIELIDAFPTTLSPMEFNNDLDTHLEASVTFSYTNWREVGSSQFSFKI